MDLQSDGMKMGSDEEHAGQGGVLLKRRDVLSILLTLPIAGSALASKRGMTIPSTEQYSFEGTRLGVGANNWFNNNNGIQDGNCAPAMRALYYHRYGFDIGPTGGNGGAFNYGLHALPGMTRISPTADPLPGDMLVFAPNQHEFGWAGHCGICAYSLGNKVVVVVDSNYVHSLTGGAHVMYLKQYGANVMYQRPNDPPAGWPIKPQLPDNKPISYFAHIQDTGDWTPVNRGEIVGDVGLSKRMEGIEVTSSDRNVYYQAHIQNVGWSRPCRTGDFAGTRGQSLRMEAVKMNVDQGVIEYWIYCTGLGWRYGTQGSVAGTQGQSRPTEAIAIRIKD